MNRMTVWNVILAGLALTIAGALVIRAGLQPCAWLDRALNHSGCLYTLETQEAAIDSVSFSPDGHLLATSSRDGRVRLWRMADRTVVSTLEAPGVSQNVGYSYDIAFAPDGKILAFGLPDGTIRLWQLNGDLQDPKVERSHMLQVEGGNASRICSLSFSPDGQMLAVGAWDGSVRLWQVADGEVLASLPDHANGVVSVAFSPNGMMLATASLDGITKLWDISRGTLVHKMEDTSATTGVAFSPDGSVLAIDRHLWRVVEGAYLREMAGNKDGLGNVVFSPDGEILAAGNAWHEVRWWRVSDGALLRAVKGHTDSVNSVAFSPTGEVMASGSLDGTVRLWEVLNDNPNQ
jgi:WD40 repeat protein